jgi:hypothetical protein
MPIFTCFTLRLCGVPFLIKIIREKFVFMHIIGKILGGSRICSITVKTNAKLGKQKRIQKHTKMGANLNIVAAHATVGKNKNTTL